MAIESFLVRFAEPKTAVDASAAVGLSLQDQGELTRLAENGEPINADQTVWQFGAVGSIATFTEAQAWDLAYRIRDGSPDISRVEPVFLVAGMRAEEPTPAAPISFGAFFGENHIIESSPVDWALTKLNVPAAWTRLAQSRPGEAPGTGISIAHPDTGFTGHPELVMETMIDATRGRNFKDHGVTMPVDPLSGVHAGHGTATGSVFLSAGGVLIPPGVLGVAPGATLVPIRMQDSVIHFHWGNLAKSLYHAADHGAHVVSMSLGGAWGADSLRDAVDYAISKGVVLVAAAGNHTPFVCYPAKYDAVLALAGSNARDGLWSGSALGSTVDVTAPGESVWRGHVELNALGDPTYTVGRGSGTSYATALTAGVCALWMHQHGQEALVQQYGGMLGRVFRDLVRSTARIVPNWPIQEAGAGIVDADALLAAPLPPMPSPVPLSVAPVHPRVAEIASLRGESVAQTSAWLSSVLRTPPNQLGAKLDDVGAELSLYLIRESVVPRVSPPVPMTAPPAARKSSRLSQAAPGI